MTVYACPRCDAMLDAVLKGIDADFTGYRCTRCDYRSDWPEDQQWTYREMECLVCGREWVATYEAGTVQLECPGCSHMNPIDGAAE